jgi:hypothetical protein
MRFSATTLLAALPALVAGEAAPVYNGWNLHFQDSFNGASGTPPDMNTWNYVTNREYFFLPGCQPITHH